jgi:glycine/D-amino acid oxidase-like deaminating enzyme
MSNSDSYDVIVVGAGLTGALIASTLAEEGLHVVVLEAATSLGGTVKRQPGLALLGTPEPFTQLVERQGDDLAHTIWELTSENLVRLEILLDRVGVPATRIGSLRLAADGEQSTAFRDSAAQLERYGYKVGLEDDSRYGDQVAIRTSDDLFFTPYDFISKLLDHENIILELDAEVQKAKRRTDDGIAIFAHHRYLWADKVVFANGLHATRLDPGLANTLHAACVHTIVFENTNGLALPLILDNGRILFIPDGERAYLTGWDAQETEILWRLTAVANQLCPDALVHERYTTWLARSDDLLPIVGKLPADEGLYAIGGLGPFGLSLALVAADELAELILYDRQPELFALDRFDK